MSDVKDRSISVIVYAPEECEELQITMDSIKAQGPGPEICVIREGTWAEAMNKGLRQASGRWVLMLAEGQELLRGALGRLLDTCTLQGSELCISGYVKEGRLGKKETVRPVDRFTAEPELFLNACFQDVFDKGLFRICGNKLYDRELISKAGLAYREDMAEYAEMEFCFRYMRHCSNISLTGSALLRVKDETVSRTDPEACIRVIAAYNELFDRLDVDDDVINDMNNRMLRLCADSIKRYYQSTQTTDTESLCMLTGMARHGELKELLAQSTPERAEDLVLRLLLKKGRVLPLHKLLMRIPKREDITVRKPEGGKELKEDKTEAPETQAEPKGSTEATRDQAEPKDSDEAPGKEAETPSSENEGELSDSELADIQKHLESGIWEL